MDVLSHPLTTDELRSLWLFYSSPHPRDSATLTLTVDDFTKLLQSIREQDMMRSDLPKLDPAFVEHVMSEYLKGSTRYRDHPLILWPEFSTNFNSYWTRRMDIFERWKQGQMSQRHFDLPPSQPQPTRVKLEASIVQPSAIQPKDPEEYAAVRVMEAELAELSERVRSTRQQLDDERQRRHQIRDDLDEARRLLEDERNKHRDTTKQLVILEEDKMTHQIQVSRLREQIEQTLSLKESLQLDLDRTRMQLFHAKEKYEAALNSLTADNEALRKRQDVLQLELQQTQSGGANRRDFIELESQNAILRQVVDRYRRSLPLSSFNDSVDGAAKGALNTSTLLSQSDFINALMEALDKTKFLNKQMIVGSEPSSNWTKQSWQDLCVGWREAVCELCDLFASAHRIESLRNT